MTESGPNTTHVRPAHRVLRPTLGGRTIPRPVVAAGRSMLRGYGTLTAPLRPWPDFLLIGAKRSGTTSFYFHLLSHPSVLPLFPTARILPKARDEKGPHFFDSNFARGASWYRGHFPSVLERAVARYRATGPVVTGEASPYYLYHPLAAARAAEVVPHVRLLVLLRDPVERTYSHYREQRRSGGETLSFPDALGAEAERTAGEEERLAADPGARSFPHEQQSYVRQSEYVRGIRRWLEHFPRTQILVQPSELYYRDPAQVCRNAYDFLGVDVGCATPAPWLNPAPATALDADHRQQLAEHFAPFNAELEDVLGQRFDWSKPR